MLCAQCFVWVLPPLIEFGRVNFLLYKVIRIKKYQHFFSPSCDIVWKVSEIPLGMLGRKSGRGRCFQTSPDFYYMLIWVLFFCSFAPLSVSQVKWGEPHNFSSRIIIKIILVTGLHDKQKKIWGEDKPL